MPTGYTERIADGITFQEFVMQCARAMGALVSMRDEPSDAPIPERFEPSDYHTRKIESAKTELERLKAMSPEEIESQAKAEYEAALIRHTEALKAQNDLLKKYKTMLIYVKSWEPPTPDHLEFKSFMEKQIQDSIEFDCNTDYYTGNPPQKQSRTGWLWDKTNKTVDAIEYHTKAYGKEVEATESRNAWIKALRNSLKACVPLSQARDSEGKK